MHILPYLRTHYTASKQWRIVENNVRVISDCFRTGYCYAQQGCAQRDTAPLILYIFILNDVFIEKLYEPKVNKIRLILFS